MSAVNGNATPQEQSEDNQNISGTKRKRSNGDIGHATTSKLDTTMNTTVTVQDVYEILSRLDDTSLVLDHPLSKQSNTEPYAKRQKTDIASAETTVASKFNNGEYTSVSQLEADIAIVCATQLAEVKDKDGQNGMKKRLAVEDVKIMQRVMSFELRAREIFTRADTGVRKEAVTIDADTIKVETGSPNAIKGSGRTVLSLFGNAPTPRQLFSSLQRGSGPEIPLEELGLPNMLTASKLLPVTADQDLGSKKAPTFGEIFGPPSSLAQLQPPKPTRHSNRSGSISFVPGDVLTRGSRKGNYVSQPLIVGDWIAYGTAERNKEPAASLAKKRARERSQSISEKTRPVIEETPQDPAAQEEALFRAAFSSFAPTTDNSKAIIPQDGRNLVWWKRAGLQRYNNHFVLDPALAGSDMDLDDITTNGVNRQDEAALFEEAVKNFDEAAMANGIDEEGHPPRDTQVEDLLVEISELLQSLSSYQYLRNSQVSTSTRNPTSPGNALTSAIELSSEETDTYRSLRSRLAELVDNIPPYLVAKMDGEQLEELRITKKILTNEKNYSGVLEEDQVARMVRNSAAAAANLTNRASNAASSNYGQFGRSSMSSSSRPAGGAPGVYGGSRTPAPALGRTSSSQSFNTPMNTSSRQGLSQLGSFTAPANRTGSQSNFGQNTNFQQYNRPPSSQQYTQGSPQVQANRPTGYPSSTQPVYQNKTQNATNYAQNTMASNTYGRSDSPAKPSYNAQSFGQQRPPQAPMTTSQNGQQAGSGVSPNMTVEQQKILLERQRAQLAVQSQARIAAQAEMSRPESTTPQPPQQSQTNGVVSGQ